jgi:hypothetical protein
LGALGSFFAAQPSLLHKFPGANEVNAPSLLDEGIVRLVQSLEGCGV